MTSPLLYEINTRCWLRELSATAARRVTLGSVPESEITAWNRLGFTHVWLMGVWTSGPRARAIALAQPELRSAIAAILPDGREEDIGASPYAIADYRVAADLGGEDELREFRERLHRLGLRLVLDFVPNHLGLDHPWIESRPSLFVQAAGPRPGAFQRSTTNGDRWFAHGRDPYFEPWADTVQVDYRHADAREAMQGLLLKVASQCDGVRCDMAMLVLNEVFQGTWAEWPEPVAGEDVRSRGQAPVGEFWEGAIAAVKGRYPGFLFLAEAYWGLESRLQSLGLDFTYDKTLLDLVVSREADKIRAHLGQQRDRMHRSAVFLENHDEARIAARLGLEEHRAMATLLFTLPGLRLLHEGQLTGATRQVPVQLTRRPKESQTAIRDFYQQLLTTLARTGIGAGDWQLLDQFPAGLVIMKWRTGDSGDYFVVVNLTGKEFECLADAGITAGRGLETIATWNNDGKWKADLPGGKLRLAAGSYAGGILGVVNP